MMQSLKWENTTKILEFQQISIKILPYIFVHKPLLGKQLASTNLFFGTNIYL